MSRDTIFQASLFDLREEEQKEPPDPSGLLHGIHLGTSTWVYPGWIGWVYSRKHKDATSYLREYVRDRHFSTVGADFTFYQPPDPLMLQGWIEFLPPGFSMVFKVWDEITVDCFGKQDQQHSSHRAAGSINPHFLDSSFFEDTFLARFEEADFRSRIAALLFEFRASTARRPQDFLGRLETFLAALPPGYPYAVEVREPKLLGSRYSSILRSTRTAHVFNHWDRMPSLQEQMRHDLITGDRVISRILTPLKMPYATAKKKFAPYSQLLPENILPQMRQDTVALCLEAVSHRLPGYILVNNRSEGCAPLTVRALEKMLQTAVSLKGEALD
jgi:uncharacterized protein YecE (DUF72 family)